MPDNHNSDLPADTADVLGPQPIPGTPRRPHCIHRKEGGAVRFRGAQWGYNAATDHFEDLIESGIIDPAKVVRLALQNSAELAGLLLTSAALVVDLPEPQSAVQPRP
jgi:hypothetical protein